MANTAPLPDAVRADLFRQLAALERAGIPADRAFAMLNLPKREQPRLARLQRWRSLRLDIAEAGQRSGLFTAFDTALIAAAAHGGRLEYCYQRLGEHYALRAKRAAQIRSKMALPAAMMVLSCFINPLPRLATGSLSGGAYLWAALRPLLLFGALVYGLLNLPHWLERDSLRRERERYYRILMHLPVFGAMHIRRSLRDYFETLGLLLDAGLPMLSALPCALDTVRNPVIRDDFAGLAARIEGGARFSEALRERRFAGRERAYPLLLSAEASGALPEMLLRYADQETSAIALFDEQVAEWIPRLAYGLVAASMAYALLRGPGLSPQLPAELR